MLLRRNSQGLYLLGECNLSVCCNGAAWYTMSCCVLAFCVNILSVKVCCLPQVTSLFWLLKTGGTSPIEPRQSRIKDSDGRCESPDHCHEGSLPLFKMFIREGLIHVHNLLYWIFFCVMSFSSRHVIHQLNSVCLLQAASHSFVLQATAVQMSKFYQFNSSPEAGVATEV
jgi:hypothetical protein